jgi:hypothetical protein
MEHRCGARHPIDGTVLLSGPGLEPKPARLVEASISGMYVAVPPQGYCCNSVIDVEMTLPGDVGLRTFRWQAMVIRKTETGMGLMFDRLRPAAITRLLDTAAAGMPLPGRTATATVVALRGAAERTPSSAR